MKNEKGFTLMEMLIVVAIIAILVAIAIPALTSQLEKARETTDAANIRSQYAEVLTKVIEDGGNVNTGGETYAPIELKQKKSGWKTDSIAKGISQLFGDHIVGEGPNAGGTAYVKYENDVPYLVYGGGTSGSETFTINWPGLSDAGRMARSLLPAGVDTRVIYGAEVDQLSDEEKAFYEEIKTKLNLTGNPTIHFGWNPYPKIKISIVEEELKSSDFTENGTYGNTVTATRITYDPSTGEILKSVKETGKWGRHGNGKEGFWSSGSGDPEVLYEKDSQ